MADMVGSSGVTPIVQDGWAGVKQLARIMRKKTIGPDRRGHTIRPRREPVQGWGRVGYIGLYGATGAQG